MFNEMGPRRRVVGARRHLNTSTLVTDPHTHTRTHTHTHHHHHHTKTTTIINIKVSIGREKGREKQHVVLPAAPCT